MVTFCAAVNVSAVRPPLTGIVVVDGEPLTTLRPLFAAVAQPLT